MTTPRILCVCLGNICRSPTAEAVLRAHLPSAEIDSAGTASWHIGKPPYGPAQDAAAQRGYDLSPQRARQINTTDFTRFDLILAMDRQNLADLKAMAPSQGAQLALFTNAIGGGDVPDPYYTRDFDGALSLIEAAARGWSERITSSSA